MFDQIIQTRRTFLSRAAFAVLFAVPLFRALAVRWVTVYRKGAPVPPTVGTLTGGTMVFGTDVIATRLGGRNTLRALYGIGLGEALIVARGLDMRFDGATPGLAMIGDGRSTYGIWIERGSFRFCFRPSEADLRRVYNTPRLTHAQDFVLSPSTPDTP